MSKEMYNYQRKAMTAAKELNYPVLVLDAIKNATSENQILRIMITARHEY